MIEIDYFLFSSRSGLAKSPKYCFAAVEQSNTHIDSEDAGALHACNGMPDFLKLHHLDN
jgi:hypothetical protein